MVQLQQRKTFKFVMRGSEVRILSAAPPKIKGLVREIGQAKILQIGRGRTVRCTTQSQRQKVLTARRCQGDAAGQRVDSTVRRTGNDRARRRHATVRHHRHCARQTERGPLWRAYVPAATVVHTCAHRRVDCNGGTENSISTGTAWLRAARTDGRSESQGKNA
jgi:hypothetical protein